MRNLKLEEVEHLLSFFYSFPSSDGPVCAGKHVHAQPFFIHSLESCRSISSPDISFPLLLLFLAGTFARHITSHFGIPAISTGDLIRKEIRVRAPQWEQRRARGLGRKRISSRWLLLTLDPCFASSFFAFFVFACRRVCTFLQKGSALGRKVKDIVSKGLLIDDETVMQLLVQRIAEPGT